MTTTTSKVLTVRNATQLILWEGELSGQISDGVWENSYPFNHWKDWCVASVEVDPANVGRNFWTIKDNYNFHKVLEYVSDRMLVMARFANEYPEATLELEEAGALYDFIHYALPQEYSYAHGRDLSKVEQILARFGISNADILKVCKDEHAYTMKDLRRDLTDLKKIIKIKR